jgi:hypothetical protein
MPCRNPRQPIPTLSFGTDLVVCALAADHTHDLCLHLPDGFRIARTSKTIPPHLQNRRRVRPISEQQLEAELNISGRADRVRDHSRARASDGLTRKIELRVIQNVEELAAELQVEPLGKQKLLEDGEVQVGAAGSNKEPAPTEQPTPAQKPRSAAQKAHVAPSKASSGNRPTRRRRSTKGGKSAQSPKKATGARQGSKTARFSTC